jgi:rhamnogalacturonyl hydrolase YesR
MGSSIWDELPHGKGNPSAIVASRILIAPALDPGRREHTTLRHNLCAYIMHDAERTSEGGLKHGGGRETYWLDTLYYSVPVLA